MADQNADFGDWSGSCTGAAAPCVVTMDAARSVTGRFGYALTVTLTNGGGGTVTSLPNGVNCGGTCSHVFDPGTPVTLDATTGFAGEFEGWSGDCSGGSCALNMSLRHSVTATFSYPLSVSRHNAGGGTVVSNPAGIDCPATPGCSARFVFNTQVTLTGSPEQDVGGDPLADAQLGGWTGDCDSVNASNQCIVIVNDDDVVQARFTHLLAVDFFDGSDISQGQVTGTGIQCGGATFDCEERYGYADAVTITATPFDGFDFAGWAECDSVNGSACTVAMTTLRRPQVHFEPSS